MNARRFWLSAALLALCFSYSDTVAQAQRAALGSAGVAAPRASVGRARTLRGRVPAASRPAARRSAAITESDSGISASGFSGIAATGAFGLLTPSLGFNFGAANQDLWIKAAIDPATQWRLFDRQRFSRNEGFGAGFYLLDGSAYYEPPAEPSETDQTAAQEQSAPTETESAEAQPAEEQPASEAAAPVEDVGQFVLVLRNGTQLQAVAFTRANDHIVYVTSDGFRRTLALSDLDTDATIRINQERGTPLQILL
jgi:hypothetical protein